MDIKPCITPTTSTTPVIPITLNSSISTSASTIITNSSTTTTNSTPSTTTTATHLPLDYSLGNFKPAIASDFPGPYVSSAQPAIQLRDISVLTTMAATIPSPTQLLQHRVQQQQHHQAQTTATDSHHQQQQQQQDYQPVSAFKAVLPKKKTTDGKLRKKGEHIFLKF